MNSIYIAFIFLLLYVVMAYYFKTSDDYDTLILIRKSFKYVFPIIVILITLVVFPAAISKGTSSVIHFVGVMLLFSPFMVIGYNIFMWRWGLRDFYDERHIENMEYFALYLRSFKDDDHNKYYSQNVIKNINKLFCPFAIGRPYELLPPRIGAPRLYLGDNWKEHVQYLMEKAQIIILRINETENFIWEYKQVLLNNYIHKTIFWIKDSDSLKEFLSKLEEDYSIIWDKVQVDAIGEESLAFINDDEWLCFANNQGSAFLSSFMKTHKKMMNENIDYIIGVR